MARRHDWFAVIVGLTVLLSGPLKAAEPQVEVFSPQGAVKDVRQVSARFSVPMVPFGDPRLADPFEITCPEKGTARWADARNWVFDFDRDLPAGISCTFRLKDDLKAINGEVLSGLREFSFTTGGPAIRRSLPFEGSFLDEEQVFVLGLDAPADTDSVLQHAWCDIDGVQEKVGVRLLGAEERRQLFEYRRDLFDRLIRVLVIRKRDAAIVGALDTRAVLKGSEIEKMVTQPEGSPIVLLACQRHLPNGVQMRLVWGKGIRTTTGIATTTDQTIAYRVRPSFEARFHCDRVNADASCIPVLPLSLEFNAPVARGIADKIVLKGTDGKRYRPVKDENQKDPVVNGLTFVGPFPEQASFTFTLPPGFKDDAGRTVVNPELFPLTVRTDEYPPLAKFPARFGIIELNADATLPVTVRNVEAQLDLRLKQVYGPEQAGLTERLKRSWNSLVGGDQSDSALSGKVLRVDTKGEADIIEWFRRLQSTSGQEGATSLFAGSASDGAKKFTLPRPNGARSFEVMGIPLKNPGFYVVELASPRLGAALHVDASPYYVQTAALVTNLSVHLKLGRETSLVWVTSLDKGRPVDGAEVEVRDCAGNVHWSGKTDAQGLARIQQALPDVQGLPNCFTSWDHKYFVTARANGDYSFVFSDWNEGIDPWRFHLPTGGYAGPYIATTVFDRTLLRAGDSVHMKHFYRQHTGDGFTLIDKGRLPERLVIQHAGSDQKYEQPLTWDEHGIAESVWTIPQDAKLGTYQVQLTPSTQPSVRVRSTDGPLSPMTSGSFRVEAFRVPSMKAVLKPLSTPLVNARQAQVDVQLNYLSGGGAGGAEVKVRGMVQPKAVAFPDYEGFVFTNGSVKEGRERQSTPSWYSGDYELGDSSDGDEGGDDNGSSGQVGPGGVRLLSTQAITLDGAGATRVTLAKLPLADIPQDVQVELEYSDPNGELLTSSTRIALWPAKVVIGLKPDAWAASKDKIRFHAVALGLDGQPRANVSIKLDLLQRMNYSHRKRLIGGFYAYENYTEVKRVKDACSGRTDAKGLLVCEFSSPVSGNVIVSAEAQDESGNKVFAHQDVWVAGTDDWWFDVSNDDRMDVLPEKKRYEPNETAVFQVRMPFREATVLVTVEREGVLESFVTTLSGKAPVIRVPLKGSYAPNVFVSVLALRGRAAGVQPTALIDLGKPAFKLGIAEIKVGWAAHELKVDVRSDHDVYKVRDQAAVKVKVRRRDGGALRGGEILFAAVDEGLLELMPNDSWKLLDTMMSQRGIEVITSTAQMQVVGRRHYGRKALPTGGGGGRQTSRELFDTLLFWQGRAKLDANGEASIRVPINDSLTSFRLVAVANAGAGLFGTGQASIRTTQDLMLLSGLPMQVREQDRFQAGVTVRNASTQPLDVTVTAGWRATVTEGGARIASVTLSPVRLKLAPGQAQPVSWEATVPVNARKLEWVFGATNGIVSDRLKISQAVIPAVRVRTFQATLLQVDKPFELPVAIPADAIPGRGGIQLHLRAKLADELSGVKEYMQDYPYSCLEQRVSQAVALRAADRWRAVMNALPAYLDSDGLAKYFPIMREGSDTLTAYLLIIADEAGWEIPAGARERMLNGLKGFVQGRVVRYSALPTADLTLRKLSALNAIARFDDGVKPAMLGSISIDPNLWPTSGVLDWLDILKRSPVIEDHDKRDREARQIIRARLNFQGTTMGFSTERSDALWWLMCSGDSNANRVLISLLDDDGWREDLPRLVRGSMGRQHKGHWNTTVANAWGVLAMEKFSGKFEAEPVGGRTTTTLHGADQAIDWGKQPSGGSLDYTWPAAADTLRVVHSGSGKPWLTLQSRAAIPLKEAFSTGYKIERTLTAIERKNAGSWTRGDVYRVRLDIDAQSDMTWVVVHDPIPSGAAILGTGLGRDSQILARGEKRQGWVWPAFEERTFDSFRAYYEFVPKGRWTVEYTLRLNNAGRFEMPETRVEALYSPEMFGEIPNRTLDVRP